MKLTDEQLNKWLHENVMGECWHSNSKVNGGCKTCPDCPQVIAVSPTYYRTNYCQSLDAIRVVEEKVIEKVGIQNYGYFLAQIIDADSGRPSKGMRQMAMATARQRAEACKLAWEKN